MGRVPYIQANFAEEIYHACQKHMSLSLHLSPLVTCGHYITGAKLSLCTAELAGTIDNDDDDNYISSHTQDTTALRPIMFLTEMHQLLVIKHLNSLPLMYLTLFKCCNVHRSK